MLAVLKELGLDAFVEEMVKRDGIHHLSNILTMASHLHGLFDRLELWLESTEIPNEVLPMSSAIFCADALSVQV